MHISKSILCVVFALMVSFAAHAGTLILDLKTDFPIGNLGGDTNSFKLVIKADAEGTILYGGMYVHYANAEVRLGGPDNSTGAWTDLIAYNQEHLIFLDQGTDVDSLYLELQADDSGTTMYGGIALPNNAGTNGPALTLQTPNQSDGSKKDFLYLLYDTSVGTLAFAEDGAIDIGTSGSNRPKDIYATGKTTTGSLELSTPVWDDLRVDLTRATPPPSGAPGFSAFVNGIYAYHFDPNTEESIHATTQLPHRYKFGTDIKVHMHWSPTTTNTGSARWCIEYSLAETGAAFPSSTTACAVQAGSGTAKQHQYIDIATISGSAIDTVSATIVARIYRDADDATDTYDADAVGIEIDYHFQADKLGTATEW